MKYSNYYKMKCISSNVEFDKNFAIWMNLIEKNVYNTINVLLIDLPDEDYMIMYENGYDYNKVSDIIITEYTNNINFIV